MQAVQLRSAFPTRQLSTRSECEASPSALRVTHMSAAHHSMPVAGFERPGLVAWRHSSWACVDSAMSCSGLFVEFLHAGGGCWLCIRRLPAVHHALCTPSVLHHTLPGTHTGPEALKSLRRTVERLEGLLKAKVVPKREEQFQKLQVDLKVGLRT